jgi:hypothetical protein
MNPDTIDETRRERWCERAGELAGEFSKRLSHWEGAAGALAFYRASGRRDEADALERRYLEGFSHLQTIRDHSFLETHDPASLEHLCEGGEGNSFTRHIYALSLFEDGNRTAAEKVMDAALKRSKLNSDALVSAIEILTLMKEFDRARDLAVDYLAEGGGWDYWEWSIHILKYYAGDWNEQKLLDAAGPFNSQVCYARHNIGVSYLARGNVEKAREHFRAVIDTGRIGWGAYQRSRVYLKRLDEDRNWLQD